MACVLGCGGHSADEEGQPSTEIEKFFEDVKGRGGRTDSDAHSVTTSDEPGEPSASAGKPLRQASDEKVMALPSDDVVDASEGSREKSVDAAALEGLALSRAARAFIRLLGVIDVFATSEEGQTQAPCGGGGHLLALPWASGDEPGSPKGISFELDLCRESDYFFAGTGDIHFLADDPGGPFRLQADFGVAGIIDADCRADITFYDRDRFEGEICGRSYESLLQISDEGEP